MKDIQGYKLVMDCHDWVVDKTEGYGMDGVLSQLRCAKCGVTHIGITSIDRDSTLEENSERDKSKLVIKTN